MVIHTTGQATLTTEIAQLFSTGQYGDDGTLESQSDSGLISPLVDTSKPLTGVVTGNNMQFIHDLESNEANGDDLREFGLFLNGDNVNRVTTTLVEKDERKEITTFSLWSIRYN